MRAGPIVQRLMASQNGGTGVELLHKISESGLDLLTWAARWIERPLEAVAAEVRALAQGRSQSLIEWSFSRKSGLITASVLTRIWPGSNSRTSRDASMGTALLAWLTRINRLEIKG